MKIIKLMMAVLGYRSGVSKMNTHCGWFKGLGIAYCGSLGTAVLQTFTFSANCANAQELKPIADTTLGTYSSIVTPLNSRRDSIRGGAPRGANLLHSFSQFNIGEGRQAYFDNPDGIENIIGRVTGTDASKIFGRLGVLGNANLFLINPNGIIFGPNASLDIRGSFVASTASSLKFADGFEFSATNPQSVPLLTISVPIGLQYGGKAASTSNPLIEINRSTLRVSSGRTLALVGGDVSLDGGILSAGGAQVELGGLAEPGTVGLNISGNNLSLNFPANVARASVSLTNGAEVNVASGGGGSIAINARNIDVLGGSYLRAGISPLQGNVSAQAGDVNLNATGTLRIENSSIYNAAFDSGNGGDLRVDTGKLIVQDGVLATATFSAGRAGDLIVKASESVELTGSPASNGTVAINIPTTLFGEVIIPAPIGLFSASIYARNLPNVPPELNNLLPTGGGNAGSLTIETGRLIVSDGAVVSAGTTTTGRGGNLTVNANDFIELSGTSANDAPLGLGLFTLANRVPSGLRNETAGRGPGGNLTINTGRLIIRDGAWLTTGTGAGGEMPAGELTVNALESVELSGTSLANGLPSVVASGTQGAGNANNLTINTRQLTVRDGAIITAGTSGSGQGGDLTINASESVQLIGTSRQGLSPEVLQDLIGVSGGGLVFEFVENRPFPSGVITGTAGGDAGNLTINTGRLSIQGGAQASVSTVGPNNAGNLTVRASAVELSGTSLQSPNPNDIVGRSLLSTAVGQGSTGNGGNIDIFTDYLSVDNDARISASTAGLRNAGTINVQAQQVSLTNNGQIRSTVEPTATGDGKQISIRARSLNLTNGAQITTETQGEGNAGSIDINLEEDIALSGSNTGIFASTRDSLVRQVIAVTESSDVGQLLSTAQNLTLQPGIFVTSISGNLDDVNDVDLYKIFLTGGQPFSATTVGGSNFDTQLFLFDANGRGVYANDDSPDGTTQSTLPAAHPLTPTRTGFYYLGISSYDNDPQSDNGRIFNSGLSTVGSTGIGGDLPLSNWDNRGFKNGNYTITLTGTVPDTPQLVLGGDGGNININSQSLFATDGAQVNASTSGQGKAGSVYINTRNTVFLNGAGTEVSANTAPNLNSTAGDVTINTSTLQVQNQAKVTVSSPQGQAGNLNLGAKRILLNQGSITAETGITGDEQGANITLQGLDLLLMRNGSRISAQATGNANGGNVTIDAAKGFVIAAPAEDNDIIASAEFGEGGNIEITTQGIFGLAEGRAISGNRTNDIDASSEFSTPGRVSINTPDVDPNRGLVELPSNLVDASQQIATGCTPQGKQASSLVVTGRGGLPLSPLEPLRSRAVITQWVTLDEQLGHTDEEVKPVASSKHPAGEEQPIVEANGWIRDDKGNVYLVAYKPEGVSHSAAQMPGLCQ